MGAKRNVKRAVAVLVVAAAIGGCGDGGGDTAAVGAEPIEDGDNPTPAPPPPTLAEGCPDGAAPSPAAAADALSGTPAWSTVERERVDDFAAVAARSGGSFTGTVVRVAQGGRFPSEFAPLIDADEESVRLTADLLVEVAAADGALAGPVAPGATVAVPLVVFDGSVEGLADEDVATMHANLTRQIDCAMPRERVTVVGTIAEDEVSGAGAVVSLPELGWLPDPGAVAFEAPGGGVESLDWLVEPAESAGFYGATTLDEVTAVAGDAF